MSPSLLQLKKKKTFSLAKHGNAQSEQRLATNNKVSSLSIKPSPFSPAQSFRRADLSLSWTAWAAVQALTTASKGIDSLTALAGEIYRPTGRWVKIGRRLLQRHRKPHCCSAGGTIGYR